MTDAQMRREVMDMYPNGINWHRRVSKMPNNMIFAIWKTKQERDAKKQKELEAQNADISNSEVMHSIMTDNTEPDDYHQIDIWEWLLEEEGSI